MDPLLLRKINLEQVLREDATTEADLPPQLSEEQLEQMSEEQIRQYYQQAPPAADAAPAKAASPSSIDRLAALRQRFPSAAPAELMAKWFPGLQLSKTDVPNPTAVLLCFHSSGNAEDMWTSEGTGTRRAPSPLLQACRQHGWKLLAVQLPGRSQRLREAPLLSLQELARQLLPVVAPELLRVHNCRYALLGHSMGAWAAYELLLELARAGFDEPGLACLSAMPWPHIPLEQRPWRQQRLLDESRFVEECRGWDINEQVFSPGMWQMYQPMLRADFRLFDEYQPSSLPRLQAEVGSNSSGGSSASAKPFSFPMRLFWGSRDKRVKHEMVQKWAGITSGHCSSSCIEGSHLWPLEPGPKQQWLRECAAALVEVLVVAG